ncbi:hypothetical protein ACFOEE_12610 [Pseudoalteromonas fenneropenaei]|uniref:Uncharacterized protein n=1 Tax=Pseudoalteromonas fenneropenaei TaxID=1737459 RepID=A0ABV7CLG0_9GAMM
MPSDLQDLILLATFTLMPNDDGNKKLSFLNRIFVMRIKVWRFCSQFVALKLAILTAVFNFLLQHQTLFVFNGVCTVLSMACALNRITADYRIKMMTEQNRLCGLFEGAILYHAFNQSQRSFG